MNHKKQLSKVVDSLIEGDSDKASKMLHSVLVEKSRSIFENLLNEEEDDAFDMNSTEDFVDDIESDMDEIDDDEMDGEVEDDEDEEMLDDMDGEEMGEEDEDVEQRVEDLETALSELHAEFDSLLADELENEDHHDDLASELGLEGEEDEGEDMDMEDDSYDVEFGMEDGEGDLEGEDMDMEDEDEDEYEEDEDEDEEIEESKSYEDELLELSEAIDDLIDSGASSRFKDESGKSVSPVSKSRPPSDGADAVDFSGGGEEKGEMYDKDGSYGDEYHESNYESHLDANPVDAKDEDGDNTTSPIGSKKLKESRRKKNKRS